jgi:hypothetical protein
MELQTQSKVTNEHITNVAGMRGYDWCLKCSAKVGNRFDILWLVTVEAAHTSNCHTIPLHVCPRDPAT